MSLRMSMHGRRTGAPTAYVGQNRMERSDCILCYGGDGLAACLTADSSIVNPLATHLRVRREAITMERRVIYLSALILVAVIAGAAVFSLQAHTPSVKRQNITSSIPVPVGQTTSIEANMTNTNIGNNTLYMSGNATIYKGWPEEVACSFGSSFNSTFISAIGFNSYTGVGHINNLNFSYNDYVIQPGKSGTIYYKVARGKPVVGAHIINGSQVIITTKNTTLPAYDLVMLYKLNTNSSGRTTYGKAGLNVSITPKSEDMLPNSSYTTSVVINVSSMAPYSTYLVKLLPSFCGGLQEPPILLTVGNTPYNSTVALGSV